MLPMVPDSEPQPFTTTPSYDDLSPWRRRDALARLRQYTGVRVSWGAVAAGTVALLATSLILWALALGVIAVATRPTAASLRGGMIALWGCALLTTLVGAFVGGMVAGFVRGSARRPVGVAHGLLSWGLAFVLSFGVQLFLLRGLAGTAAEPIHEVTQQPVPSSGPHMHANPSNEVGAVEAPYASAARDAIVQLAGIGWSSFVTWVLAGMLAAAGADLVVRRLIDRREFDGPFPMHPAPGE